MQLCAYELHRNQCVGVVVLGCFFYVNDGEVFVHFVLLECTVHSYKIEQYLCLITNRLTTCHVHVCGVDLFACDEERVDVFSTVALALIVKKKRASDGREKISNGQWWHKGLRL